MSRLLSALALALATAHAAPLLAAELPQVDGEITKIDRAQGKVGLRHGEIRNLEMPAMSMVFRIADPKLLDGVAVGDKVRFTADKVNGTFTVTTLVKRP